MSYAKKHHKHLKPSAAKAHVFQDLSTEMPATPDGDVRAVENDAPALVPSQKADELSERFSADASAKGPVDAVSAVPPLVESFILTAPEAESRIAENDKASVEATPEAVPGTAADPSSERVQETGIDACEARQEAVRQADESPAAQEPVEKAAKTNWRKCLVIVFAGIVAIGLAGAAFVYWDVYKRALDMPVGVDTVDIMVEEGDSARRIIGKLRDAGVAIEDRHLRILARLHPDAVGKIHTGLYRFERGITPEGVIAQFAKGALIDQEVRIPDGAAIWDVRRILSEAVNLKPASANLDDVQLRAQLGLGDYPSIEGFIAPETYRYGSGSQDVTILRMAVERQKRLLENFWTNRSEECVLKTPYELLIMASIIEKETGEKSDRHLVSSVFNNRLKVGMPLQTDPTVIYGLGPNWKGRLTRKDLQSDTPYNTYKIPALPPTPIGMPSAASIEAAANPAKTRYLYFVARGDGTSEFTTNLADHNKAVQHFIVKKRTTPLNLPQKKTGKQGDKDDEKPLRAQ